MKKCKVCHKTKSLASFRYYNRPNCQFYSGQCLSCLAAEKKAWVKANFDHDNARNKAYNREHAHIIRGNKIKIYWPGTDWQQAMTNYKIMRDKQNGVCALCNRPEKRQHAVTGTTWDLAIDHCHETGRVRGLLCNACNRGLGLLGDKIDTLEKVLAYLKKHQEE